MSPKTVNNNVTLLPSLFTFFMSFILNYYNVPGGDSLTLAEFRDSISSKLSHSHLHAISQYTTKQKELNQR